LFSSAPAIAMLLPQYVLQQEAPSNMCLRLKTSIFVLIIVPNLNTALCAANAGFCFCHSILCVSLLRRAKLHRPHQFVAQSKEPHRSIIQFCWDGEGFSDMEFLNIYRTTDGFRSFFNESLQRKLQYRKKLNND